MTLDQNLDLGAVDGPPTPKPKIFVWLNGGGKGPGDVLAEAIAEDGTPLAHHVSSNESWAKVDMGLAAAPGVVGRKHELYDEHYPDGWELVWVPLEQVEAGTHAGFEAALARNREARP